VVTSDSLRRAFVDLHRDGCFAIPNPWDRGSVRLLEELGFKALATTSAGFSFSKGLPDALDLLSVDEVLEHISEIASVSRLPVNADFQSGYAGDPEGVADNVRRCVATGIAGLSIEDASGADELFELEDAVERVRAAHGAIEESGLDVLLTARAECFLVGHPNPLAESVRRIEAYAAAGADVLFVPGVREKDHIRTLVSTVAPRPLNVLMSSDTGLQMADLEELGVRRVSLGSALSRVAWGAFLRAARAIAQDGSFAGLREATPFDELNQFFTVQRPD
jgi:2-methylisocitrate lyase-like PEP mutase family enzyme